jgi:ubiquinone/menaquinone biosynthesis C-methylase UbiE
MLTFTYNNMQPVIKTVKNTDEIKNSACGCGSGGCGSHSGIEHDHGQAEHNPDLPSRFQLIQEGDRVVEFGSGVGTDSFSMASIVGPSGKVIGIDKSELNIETSRGLLDSLKTNNIEFRQGNIESAPVADEYADVVYSTCVFNLQADKQKVADEMYRVVKHSGYVCVSDFVTLEDIPDALRKEATSIAGCIAGAEKVGDFMDYFRKTGFSQGGIVEVNKVKLPDELLEKYLDTEMIRKYNDINSDEGIFSVVLVVEKPETCSAETCCHNADKHKN